MKRSEGMTLLELMMVMFVMTVVMGMLYTLAGNLGNAVAAQESRITTQDDLRNAMLFLGRELRQASQASIQWGALPAQAISYQRATDADGNGLAVDQGVFLELTPVRTIQRDVNDLNGDGRRNDQLIMIENGVVTVISNGLLVNEDLNANGALDGNEDTNFNNQLDRGVWFQVSGTNGIQITLQAQRQSSPRINPQMSSLTEVVVPRN